MPRGLALVECWLLTLPHYLVRGSWSGATSTYDATSGSRWPWGQGPAAASGELIGLLVLCAGVTMVHRALSAGLYDLVMALDR